MFRSLAIASSGLSAQRVRMEIIASNIANAETTHDANGAPYRRQVAVLAPGEGPATATAPAMVSNGSGPFGGVAAFAVPGIAPASDAPQSMQVPVLQDAAGGAGSAGVHVAGIAEDPTQGQLVYDPGNPDANKSGYVRYPNVRITDEMVDMMDARRVYEANATVFQSAKAMLREALNI